MNERPDLWTLGRRATGEEPGPVPEEYARALDWSKQRVAPFDAELLRARAVRLADRPAPRRPRPRRPWWFALAPALAAAAALLFIVTPRDGLRAKGDGAYLDYFVWQDGRISPGEDDQVLGEGDRVQFTYMAAGLDTLVLLSVDGEGTLTVFWPEQGDRPEPIQPHGTHLLSGSVRLDDAAGPEVFVALFGFDSVDEAQDIVAERWDDAGLDGLLALDDNSADIATIIIEKEE